MEEHKRLINNKLFDDNSPSLFEKEVRISEKIPASTHKGDSIIGGEEEYLQNESAQKDLLLKKQNSNQPIESMKEGEDPYFEDFKSNYKEKASKVVMTTKKQGNKKKGKGQKGINNSKASLLIDVL